VRYQARNTGDLNVYSCDIGDSNPGLPGEPAVGDIPTGGSAGFFNDEAACSDELALGEPDTATLSCFCSPDLDGGFKASATDEADFECQTPGLEVTKTCDEVDALGNADVSITVTNTGTAPLVNCQVTDELYRDDPTCPADVGAGDPQQVTPDMFDLPSGSQGVTGTVNTFHEACNKVSVTCEIAGTGKTITATADDVCEVGTCTVEVDKQISCDGGLTWLDDNGFVSNNEDGTNDPCAGWNAYTAPDGSPMPAEAMMVRYQARNTGDLNVYSCDIGDSNPGLPGEPAVGDIPTGGSSGFFNNEADCSDELALGEPDTATLSCFCSPDLDDGFTTSANDEADFECKTPGLQVTKTCDEVDALGNADVSITVTNTGTAALENCQVSDLLFPDASVCPTDVGVGEIQTVTPDMFDLPSGSQEITGTVNTFMEACNQVTVTCDIVGTDKTIIAEASDICEVGTCQVQVDKQISCDGGLTWVDDNGFVGANEDGTDDPCFGWNAHDSNGTPMGAEAVIVRYQARNIGDLNVYSCSIGDSNPGLPGQPAVGDIPAGGSAGFFSGEADCSDGLDANEPDTATLDCFCSPGLDSGFTTSASDQANFECQTPALRITKECLDPDVDGIDAIDISVFNEGDADLINCHVVDEIYQGSPSCGTPGTGDSLNLIPDGLFDPADFHLGGGASVDIDSAVAVIEESCNRASVECNIADENGNPVMDPGSGLAKVIRAEATDQCEPPECMVEVDKQISCDGGFTWHDVGLVTSNDDGDNVPCVGWNAFLAPDGSPVPAEEILVRYRARNDSANTLYACTVSEGNPGLPGVGVIGDLGPGEIQDFYFPDGAAAACSPELAAEEPDTATLTCFCSADLNFDFQASATDGANFDCQTPGLEVTKVCGDPNSELGTVPFEITVTNTGGVDGARRVRRAARTSRCRRTSSRACRT
jgi:hypothetical protein